LIRVTCAECGEEFEIGEDFAGITEFCPACGALNDIPPIEPQDEEQDTPSTSLPLAVEDAERVRSGIPAPLWWTILLVALGLFIGACVFLFADNWESRNVQALSDATNRGDDFLADQDYTNALSQYQFVLDTVDHRKIESSYIQQLIERSRYGIANAEARQKTLATATTAPTTEAVATTQVVPATQPGSEPQLVLAMKMFQRNREAFGRFMRDHPIVFRDRSGTWRQRRYVVWDEDYDEPQLKEPLRVTLRFSVGSQITDPHFSRRDAESDDNFVHDESPSIVQCQTYFDWTDGRWEISRHETSDQKEAHVQDDVRPSLDDFFALERGAFGAVGK
jgi:hypothetical protein